MKNLIVSLLCLMAFQTSAQNESDKIVVVKSESENAIRFTMMANGETKLDFCNKTRCKTQGIYATEEIEAIFDDEYATMLEYRVKGIASVTAGAIIVPVTMYAIHVASKGTIFSALAENVATRTFSEFVANTAKGVGLYLAGSFTGMAIGATAFELTEGERIRDEMTKSEISEGLSSNEKGQNVTVTVKDIYLSELSTFILGSLAE